MDGFLLFKYSQLDLIKTNTYKKAYIKVKVGIDSIVKEKEEFENRGWIAFRRSLKVPGNYQSDSIFQVVTFYFPATEPEDAYESFKVSFWKAYLTKVTKQKNLLILQMFQDFQQIELQFYGENTKLDPNNPQAETYFTSVSDNGLVLSTEKIISPSSTNHSFRYSQMLSCKPEDPQISKDKMPQDFATVYQPNDACIGVVVDWNSRPFYDLFCSTYKKSYKFKVDRTIFAATIFKKCFDKAMEEIVQLLKNTAYNLRTAELSMIRRQKYVMILDDILNFQYDLYVNTNSQFYINYHILKPGAKKYMMDLIMTSMSNQEASSASSSSSSSTNSSSSSSSSSSISSSSSLSMASSADIERANQLDIENYSDTTVAKSNEAISLDLSSSISEKWKTYIEKYGAGYVAQSAVSTSTVSAGSVIQESSKSIQETSVSVLKQYQEAMGAKQMSYKETQKLEEFIKKNNTFFDYLKKNNQKVDRVLIDKITNFSDKEVWDYYKQKISDPFFEFIYDKKFNKPATIKREGVLPQWTGGFENKIEEKKEQWKVKNYLDLKYTDTDNFTEKKPDCEKEAGGGLDLSN
ncbi:MAG: hypothetical protein ACK5YA_00620, partial [bacterium]